MFPMSLVSIPFKLVYLVFCGNGFKIPSLMASWLTGLGSCVPVSAVCSTPGTENKQKTKLLLCQLYCIPIFDDVKGHC